MDQVGIEDRVSMTVDDREIAISDSDSEADSSSLCTKQFGVFTQVGMVRVEEEDGEYEQIKRIFLAGMGPFGRSQTNVVAIHKNSYSGLTGHARFETFRIFSEAVAQKCGGNANIKHAWYGSSKDEICQTMAHGFSLRSQLSDHKDTHGFGVYLSPANLSIRCASSSIEDENGLRHMLLCRVILGNMEEVCLGTKQFQPSSSEYDSGVDNLLQPTRYIIWSPYMNSHIFPNYVVSFKVPPPPLGLEILYKEASTVRPNSPYMGFNNLMSILSKFLDASKMGLIVKYHNDFRSHKVTRFQLIQKVRQVAGDKLLKAVIEFYRNKQLKVRARPSTSADPA